MDNRFYTGTVLIDLQKACDNLVDSCSKSYLSKSIHYSGSTPYVNCMKSAVNWELFMSADELAVKMLLSC